MVATAHTSRGEQLHPAAWGVAIYILVSVARLPELVPALGVLHLGKVSILLGIVGLIKSDVKAVGKHKIKTLIIVLSVLAVFSIAVSLWKSYSLNFLTGRFLFIILGFFLISLSVVNRKTLHFYVFTLITSMFLLGIQTVGLKQAGRLSLGSIYDPNDLCLILVVIAVISIPVAMSRKGLPRLLILLAVCTSIFAALLTQSRGGFIGMLAAASMFALTDMRANSKKVFRFPSVKVGVVSAMLLVGLIAIAPSETRERLLSTFSLEEDYNLSDSNGRIEIWKRGLNTMASRPYGAGLGVFFAAEGGQGGAYKAAHNSFIQVGVELGVVGLIVFLGMYLAGLSATKRVINYSKGDHSGRDESGWHMSDLLHYSVALRVGLVTYAVTSFFLSQAYNPLLYIILALIVALEISIRDEGNPHGIAMPLRGGRGIGNQAKSRRSQPNLNEGA